MLKADVNPKLANKTIRFSDTWKWPLGTALVPLAAALCLACTATADAPDESVASTASELLGRDEHLYFRCNSTSWSPNSASRVIEVPNSDGMFSLTYNVSQDYMTSGNGDSCSFITTNQLDGWGSAQTNYAVRGAVPVVAPDGRQLTQSTSTSTFGVRYPAKGRYTITVNWRMGSFAIAPVPVTSVLPQRSLVEANPATLAAFSVATTFDRIATNGLVTGSGSSWNDAIFRSQSRSIEFPEGTPGPFCDDPITGLSIVNGFVQTCPTSGSSVVGNVGQWQPLAVVNRFDLAPLGGEDCGEQRASFFLNGAPGSGLPSRAFMIFEAVVPNPRPEQGLEGCRPVANFWAGLSSIDDPAARGARLAQAFYTGDPALTAAGFKPFMTFENVTQRGGRVRTNLFGSRGIWHFNEYRLLDGGSVRQLPVAQSLPDSAFTPFTDSFSVVKREQCRQELKASVPLLLGGDPSELNIDVSPDCFGPESTSASPRADGSITTFPDYATELANAAAAAGVPLTARQLGARIQMAGTCVGCHLVLPDSGANGSTADFGAGMTIPAFQSGFDLPEANSVGFAHVNERLSAPCASEGADALRTCRALSPLLKTFFLPRRKSVFENYLAHPGAFGPTSPSTKNLGGQPLARHN